MEGLLSAGSTLLAATVAAQVARQWRVRRRPYQLAWAIALLLFAGGAGAQLLAAAFGWSGALYRTWYLLGTVLAAAWLGHGSVLLLGRRRLAAVLTVVLVVGTVLAGWVVLRAPVRLSEAMAAGVPSGRGMPDAVRLLTPFFNIYGTLALVGIAGMSVWRYLWSGGSGSRAGGTALIGAGALTVALGGTLTRFGAPALLYLSELIGLAAIAVGFRLTAARVSPAPAPDGRALARRRMRTATIGIGAGMTGLTLALVSLPILPWTMGIVTDVKHSYTAELPAENRGTYLITDDGVMQLYSWYVEPSDFPEDAPVLDAARVHEVAFVQKQFSALGDYQLYDLTSGQRIPLADAATHQMQMVARPTDPLGPGDYMITVPIDSMFGGSTWQYFSLR